MEERSCRAKGSRNQHGWPRPCKALHCFRGKVIRIGTSFPLPFLVSPSIPLNFIAKRYHSPLTCRNCTASRLLFTHWHIAASCGRRIFEEVFPKRDGNRRKLGVDVSLMQSVSRSHVISMIALHKVVEEFCRLGPIAIQAGKCSHNEILFSVFEAARPFSSD